MPFFASMLLMWVVLYFIYPHYQYYIDPDGTSYLTISAQYAKGNYLRAINGYWSPWSCWLTALLIKHGLAAIPASVIINTMGATGFLFITQSLLLRFKLSRSLQWVSQSSLIVFLCYAIFAQSFDDIWECFFLLSGLRILIAKDFKTKPVLWIGLGVIGALAYFAKAYALPFFILNTIVCSYLLAEKDFALCVKICLFAVVTMVVCSFPWLYALHYKYGFWTTSTAGSLNMSWYLVGHPYYKEGINLLVPHVYKDSPYFWEDPYLVNGVTPHFWSSWHLFGLQFLRVGLNIWKLLKSMLQLSVLFPVVTFLAQMSFVRKSVKPSLSKPFKIVVTSFLLFPMGYILINFEARYLWYMLPLSIVIGGLILQNSSLSKAKYLLLFLPVSFAIYPIYGLCDMYDVGKSEYILAQELNQHHITGTFTANTHPASMARLAYFSGNTYYFVPDKPEYLNNTTALLNDANRYNVAYYLMYNCNTTIHNTTTSDSLQINGKLYNPIWIDTVSGLRVYAIGQF